MHAEAVRRPDYLMSERYRDFDAWEAERKQEPLRFRFHGQEFDLPPSLPAIIPIRAMRLQKQVGADGDVPEGELMELALSLFGEEQLERLLETGVGMDTLGEIVQWAVAEYGAGAAEQGNAPGPDTDPGQTS